MDEVISQPQNRSQTNLSPINTAPIQNSAPATNVNTNSTPKHRATPLIVIAVILVLAVCFIVLVGIQRIFDLIAGIGYTPSAELSEVVAHDNFTDDGMLILKATRPELQSADNFNSNCPSATAETSTLGCYYRQRIFVYDIDNSELNGIKEAVLAHELLHAVWERMSVSERLQLQDDLDKVYRENYDVLSEHMSSYTDDVYYDELHSIIGTQINESKLTASLVEHYRQYFADQDTIVGYFNSYNSKFLALKEKADELYEQIEAAKTEIDTLTEEYESAQSQLEQDVQEFNSKWNSGEYAGQSYAALIAPLQLRQYNLRQQYDELSAKIDAANELVKQYNDNIARSNSLYQSINSNATKYEDQL